MSSNETRRSLRAAVGRVSGEHGFVSSLFPAWETAFGAKVEHGLASDEEAVVSLGLCLRPRAEAWEHDVGEIAAACGIDAGRLGNFLRQAFAVERLAAAPQVGEVVDGRLLAARDHEDKQEE
jgi:hypothetical protein